MTTLLPVAGAPESWRLARTLLLRRRGALAACCATYALTGLAGLIAPWWLGRIVDLVREGGSRSEMVVASSWILGAAVVIGITTWASIALTALVTEPALAELREHVLERALHLDLSVVEAAGQGDLLSRVGDDVRLIAQSLTQVLPQLINSVVAIAFTAAGLFALDWRLGLAGLGAFPAYALALRWYLPRSGPYYRREREANGERAEALLTGIHGSRTLRAFGIAQAQQERVDDASWNSARISIDVYAMFTRFGARINRGELIGLLLLVGVGFQLVRTDATSVGAVTTAALLFHRLFNPIGAVLYLFDEAQSAGASLTRLVGLARAPIRERQQCDDLAPADSGLSVRSLHHEYAAGRAAVADVSLTVRPGERLAIVGASGAGKTTLGAVVAGQLVPTRGEVLLGGVPLLRATPGARPTVALVTQEVHVFSGSVRDNLTLAAPAATDADVEAALRVTGAWGWVQALTAGVDAAVGDGATPLTTAQAQQLALARVVLADPVLVVLDEATAEAGSAGARDLEQAATAATTGRTSLTIAHRLTQARTADRIVVMDAGRVVEQGTHDELVAAGGSYATLWAAWSTL